MKYLLDSDVCSEFIRGNPVVTRRYRIHIRDLCVSAVSVAELFVWAHRSRSSSRWLPVVRTFLLRLPVLDVDLVVAEQFGQLRAQSFDQGRPLPAMDLLIAATALTRQATLVTHNQKDFVSIPGLLLEDWQTPSP